MTPMGHRHIGVVGAAFCALALAGTAHGQWTTNGNDAYFNLSGHCGVGTTTPSYKVDALETASTNGTRAIYGLVNATTGVTNGVYGQTSSSSGRGVIGVATATSGSTIGTAGNSSSTTGVGVNGYESATSGICYGIFGECLSTSGTGAFGWATATTGTTFGMRGESDSPGGYGVYGYAPATGNVYSVGVQGESAGAYGTGVVGLATSTSLANVGVAGQTDSDSGKGTVGQAVSTSGNSYGVYGLSASNNGTGVYGRTTSTASGTPYGVYGKCDATTGSAYGVYGQAATGYGVYSNGASGASGTKSFRIDHPADPENKYLLHYSVESPEVLNLYSGKITLDGSGAAVVELPAYFASVNTDPRYTLTAMGAPMPLLHIAEEISEAALVQGARAEPGDFAVKCSFRIAGGMAGARVSWRVEALRNDRWVQVHGAPVEVMKPDSERGTYQQPELFGKPAEMATSYRPASEPFMTILPQR